MCAIPAQDGMMEKINEASNQCLFLLNGVLLGTLFSALSLITVIYYCFIIIFHFQTISNIDEKIFVYIVLTVFSLIVSFIFYEASLFNVGQFGSMIKASYDIYRFNLLRALHFKLPQTLDEEKKTWLKISHFMTGNEDYEENEDNENNNDSLEFIYDHHL